MTLVDWIPLLEVTRVFKYPEMKKGIVQTTKTKEVRQSRGSAPKNSMVPHFHGLIYTYSTSFLSLQFWSPHASGLSSLWLSHAIPLPLHLCFFQTFLGALLVAMVVRFLASPWGYNEDIIGWLLGYKPMIGICTCVHVYIYICMYVCMHACMYACMYVCIYVYKWSGCKLTSGILRIRIKPYSYQLYSHRWT